LSRPGRRYDGDHPKRRPHGPVPELDGGGITPGGIPAGPPSDFDRVLRGCRGAHIEEHVRPDGMPWRYRASCDRLTILNGGGCRRV
jgi:hypothetical protein